MVDNCTSELQVGFGGVPEAGSASTGAGSVRQGRRRGWVVALVVAGAVFIAGTVVIAGASVVGGASAAPTTASPVPKRAAVTTVTTGTAVATVPTTTVPPAAAPTPTVPPAAAPTPVVTPAAAAALPAATPTAPVAVAAPATAPPIATLVAEAEATGIQPGPTWTWTVGDTQTECGVIPGNGAGTGCTFGAAGEARTVFGGTPSLALVAHELANAETENDAAPALMAEVTAAEAGSSWSPIDAVASCLVEHFMGFQDDAAGAWQCPAGLAAVVASGIHDAPAS